MELIARPGRGAAVCRREARCGAGPSLRSVIPARRPGGVALALGPAAPATAHQAHGAAARRKPVVKRCSRSVDDTLGPVAAKSASPESRSRSVSSGLAGPLPTIPPRRLSPDGRVRGAPQCSCRGRRWVRMRRRPRPESCVAHSQDASRQSTQMESSRRRPRMTLHGAQVDQWCCSWAPASPSRQKLPAPRT